MPQESVARLTAALPWEWAQRERALNMVSSAVRMNNPLGLIKIAHKSNCIDSLMSQKILFSCPNSGIGGLQFGVQPHTAGMNGAANYGKTMIYC